MLRPDTTSNAACVGGAEAAGLGLCAVPVSPVPHSDQKSAFRAAFCEEYARRGDGRGVGAAAVRAALARVGGSKKARTRPGEVARRLLVQEPVRTRIAELRGWSAPAAPRQAVPAIQPAIPAKPTASIAPPQAMLPPDTAARLAAVAFDPAMPAAISCAAIEALRAALDARHAALIRATE